MVRLSPVAETAGYQILHRPDVISTMDEARALAQAGQAVPFWLVADQQTGGRGRQGRVWASPPGNFYATLFITDPCAQADAPKLGFVASLALHDAACALAPKIASRLQLKWPNDLLLGEAKCGGMLLEGQMRQGRFEVMVGIGVNLVSSPTDTPYPAVWLGADIAPAAVLEALSESWIARLAVFGSGAGFAAIRAAWLERAAFRGTRVTLRLPEGPVTGTFEALDPDGRLILQQDAVKRIIDAGDLFFRAPAPAQ
jgi:BirA family biotin operon repressor/biotin-[acetyl-CoA-carboxylase] ligase